MRPADPVRLPGIHRRARSRGRRSNGIGRLSGPPRLRRDPATLPWTGMNSLTDEERFQSLRRREISVDVGQRSEVVHPDVELGPIV